QWTADWNFGTLGRGTMNNTFTATCGSQVVLAPVAADVTHTIAGNNIVVPAGGATVTLDLQLSGWGPDQLGAYRARIDSSGYGSGMAGTLSPVTTPDPSAGAFVDTARTDYVFFGQSDTPTVDTTTLDYEFASSIPMGGTVPDPATAKYAGTLKLDVSPDAAGIFTVDLLPEPQTQLSSGVGPITPLSLTPATITVAPAHTLCAGAVDITCDTSLTFDNSLVSNPPSPGYSCGAGNSHAGTLWFQFTATNTTARLQTCGSVAQDSTLAVYDGGCGALVEIGCGEDDCGASGFLTDQTITGLTIGQSYLIQISAWQPSDRGDYTLQLDCNVVQAGPPQPDSGLVDAGFGTRNRYLSFRGGDAGRSQAIRVTVVSAPPAFAAMVGKSMWVTQPQDVSENSGVILPVNAPNFATLKAATLDCSPFAMDWSALGVIHISHNAIIPGATYDVQVVDADSVGFESAFSEPLRITTGNWGDILDSCGTPPCGPPNGTVDIIADVIGLLDKFRNLASAVEKSRADLTPATPDRIIDIADVSAAVNAFAGKPFPFAADVPCP
ncbi:MAG: hypothetical protein ACE5EX_09735, partial [Phycisphaerae bacterium]